MNSGRSNNLIFKYQSYTQSGCKNIGMGKLSLWQRFDFFNVKFFYKNFLYPWFFVVDGWVFSLKPKGFKHECFF